MNFKTAVSPFHSPNLHINIMVSAETFSVPKKKKLRLNIHKINSTCSKPRVAKRLFVEAQEDKCSSGAKYSASAKKGNFRQSMQDVYNIFPHQWGGFTSYGVFDGHHSSHAAVFASETLQKSLSGPSELDLVQAFYETDKSYMKKYPDSLSGSTASVLLVSDSKLVSANVGDSPILLVTESSCVELSTTHNTSSVVEKDRIEKLGGYILPAGSALRVQGVLTVTRSIGDKQYKELLTPSPCISVWSRRGDELFAVVASDGLFEGLSYQEVSDFLKENRKKPLSHLAEELTNLGVSTGKDNVTAVVIDLRESQLGNMTPRNTTRTFSF